MNLNPPVLFCAAVALGAESIALGLHSVVVAGGMESMSQAPFLLPRTAPLRRTGDVPLLDSVLHEGLRDSETGHLMGVLAQECVDEMRISREDQVRRGCVDERTWVNVCG